MDLPFDDEDVEVMEDLFHQQADMLEAQSDLDNFEELTIGPSEEILERVSAQGNIDVETIDSVSSESETHHVF